MLHRCPEIARHVQKLVLRPNSYCNHERKRQRQGRSEGEGEDGYAVCWFVRQLASKLDALNTFVWDWEGGLPPSDDLWLALRMS
jgi:hypothetical protein